MSDAATDTTVNALLRHDALLKSYGDAGALAGYWVGLNDLSDLDKEHIRHSYIGFAVGFAVEFLLFLFSFITLRVRVRSGSDYRSFEAYRNSGKMLSEAEIKSKRPVNPPCL